MNILELPINVTLPKQSIGVVIMQPFAELDISREPFTWQAAKKASQIAAIEETLRLAMRRPANQPISFTIFPEYSIPGLDGINAVERILAADAWPENTVVIAGIDGLIKGDYAKLFIEGAIQTAVHEQNEPARLADNEWINCAITWIKSDNLLRRWIQPKLAPAQLENNVVAQRMFRGQGVFVFKCTFDNGSECRFMTLICFDWIDANSGLWRVLEAVNEQSTANREINLFFVIQHNPKPNDNLFVEHARRYFEEPDTSPRLNRAEGALLFANTAGRPLPGLVTKFGFSSLICAPCNRFDEDGCPATFAISTERLRSVPNLKRCREALLRENGACIHSFGLRLPRWINPSPADRAHPIENALVHPLNGGINEPRTTGSTVPAVVKWCNDHLTTVESLLSMKPANPLKPPLDASQLATVEDVRHKEADALVNLVNILSVAISVQESQDYSDKWTNVGKRRVQNVDNWNADDQKTLAYLVWALAILKLSNEVEVAASPAHGTLRISNELYDVAVVCGPDHDQCERNARERFARNSSRHVLVITKDLLHGFKRRKRSAQIDDTGDSELDIANPSSGWHFCDYADLISTVNAASSQATLATKVTEVLAL